MDRTLIKMKRRLEREELVHLRQHCAELAERLEKAEIALHHAEEDAIYAADWAQRLQEFQPVDVGILRDGTRVVVTPPAAGGMTGEGACA